ncbi:YHS domain-containing (seleno)protein [Aureibacter tunicatorum]|uniref:YHS domain-containing protein n=1 Tax=Aureibacter tunicatorum TaxID=866807 RepID=A0AAE3XP53_9BACT|nr:YHS domain-containing (seleno)protein [Aureibacter tunicatorum]MDR6239356.1 YHS domain-containing protein [Aureibacter tunicatorum]BDD04721.1 hypothetical protein AUTU_22040 [Aureibacter tunicatorum]
MKTKSLISLIMLLLPLWTMAQESKQYNLEKGVGSKGYDVVSYFDNSAKKGSKKISAEYKGVKYYFSSDANKAKFEKNPEKYAPQYGGWCAYAMGKEAEKVDVDPNTFEIMDGKLYLFYNKFFNNTKEKWDKNPEQLRKLADENWQKILRK